MGSGTRHPVLVDTDALIAVANTDLWPKITETLNLTTTNVCVHELKRHVQETSEYPLDGSREQWIRNGSGNALAPFEDDANSSFTVVSSVPRPHGEDAGEQSLQQEVSQQPGAYTFAVLMDREGRTAINRQFDQLDTEGRAVAPPFLLYLLFDADACTKEEFCRACGELLKGEGWTGYQAVQAAWEAIPVDCSGFLSDDILPT
jgi:hypothetical protein